MFFFVSDNDTIDLTADEKQTKQKVVDLTADEKVYQIKLKNK